MTGLAPVILLVQDALDTFQSLKGGVNADTQRLNYTLTAYRNTVETGDVIWVEIFFQYRGWQDVGEIALVPLHDEWKVCDIFVHAS